MGPNPTQGFIYFTHGASRKNLPRYRNQVTVDFASFQTYLEQSIRNPRQVAYRIRTAQEFHPILETGDAAALMALSLHKRLFVMKTLSKLAKFQGRYEEWQKIRQDHGLSWKEDDDVTAFKRMTEGENIDEMIAWVKEAGRIATVYKDVLVYACLTGLRAAEVFLSLGLGNTGYYDADKGLLEHYKHPDLFIRPKKKAYVSVMTKDLLNIRTDFDARLSYNALRLTMRRNGASMNMQYCRRIYGTYLRSKGIESEFIDLLQGRLPRSVFLRFYNRPNFKDECDKVRAVLSNLAKEVYT